MEASTSLPAHSESTEMVDDVYHAISKTPIPVAAYRPHFPPTFTRAPDSLPRDTCIKRPSLMSYDRVCKGALPNSIADGLLVAAQVYERLRRDPPSQHCEVSWLPDPG
ncbi:unnamed protein product [Discula destructiva]